MSSPSLSIQIVQDDTEFQEAQRALEHYLYGEQQDAEHCPDVSQFIGSRVLIYKKGMSSVYKGPDDVIKVSNNAVMLRRMALRSSNEIYRALALVRRNQTKSIQAVQQLHCPLLGAIRWAKRARVPPTDLVCVHSSSLLDTITTFTPTLVAEAIVGLLYLNTQGHLEHNDAVARNVMLSLPPAESEEVGPVLLRGQSRYLHLHKGERHAVVIDFNLATPLRPREEPQEEEEEEVTTPKDKKIHDIEHFIRDVRLHTSVYIDITNWEAFVLSVLGDRLRSFG